MNLPGHDVIYVDEASFSLTGKPYYSYAPKGNPMLVKHNRLSVTERVYAISGITPRGELVGHAQLKPYDSEAVVKFLRQILNRFQGQTHLVWDNASIHFSARIRKFLRQEPQARRLTLYRTPVYHPQYNPDEQVWQSLKGKFLKAKSPRNKTELKQEVVNAFDKLARLPGLIRSYFRHPDVKLMEY